MADMQASAFSGKKWRQEIQGKWRQDGEKEGHQSSMSAMEGYGIQATCWHHRCKTTDFAHHVTICKAFHNNGLCSSARVFTGVWEGAANTTLDASKANPDIGCPLPCVGKKGRATSRKGGVVTPSDFPCLRVTEVLVSNKINRSVRAYSMVFTTSLTLVPLAGTPTAQFLLNVYGSCILFGHKHPVEGSCFSWQW